MVQLTGGSVVVHTAGGLPAGCRGPASGLRAVRARGNNEVGFAVGPYDTTQPLVIDPVLVYSTYLGGTNNDQGMAIAVDNQGNADITGTTVSPDLAATAGALPGHVVAWRRVRLDDRGARSWSTAASGLPDAGGLPLWCPAPSNASVLYAATGNRVNFSAPTGLGIFRSSNGGQTWT